MKTKTPQQLRALGLCFTTLGCAQLAIGAAGPKVFLGVAIVFLTLGLIFSVRATQPPGG